MVTAGTAGLSCEEGGADSLSVKRAAVSHPGRAQRRGSPSWLETGAGRWRAGGVHSPGCSLSQRRAPLSTPWSVKPGRVDGDGNRTGSARGSPGGAWKEEGRGLFLLPVPAGAAPGAAASVTWPCHTSRSASPAPRSRKVSPTVLIGRATMLETPKCLPGCTRGTGPAVCSPGKDPGRGAGTVRPREATLQTPIPVTSLASVRALQRNGTDRTCTRMLRSPMSTPRLTCCRCHLL